VARAERGGRRHRGGGGRGLFGGICGNINLRRRYAAVAANNPAGEHQARNATYIQGGERVRARRDSINPTAIKKTLRKRDVTFARTAGNFFRGDIRRAGSARDARLAATARANAIFPHLARYLQNAALNYVIHCAKFPCPRHFCAVNRAVGPRRQRSTPAITSDRWHVNFESIGTRSMIVTDEW
jgi:hypothetical protein